MCDPITLTVMAATAASAGANVIGQNQVNNARNDAMTAERIRQNALDQEAQVLNDKSRDRYNNVQTDQDAKAGELASMYNQVQQSVVSPGAGAQAAPTGGGSSVVAQEFAKQGAKSNAFNMQQADAQGRVSAFGDMLGDKMRLQGRDAAQIGQIGKFKQGWASILPLALEAANQKGNTAKLIGDLARGVSAIGMGPALMAGGFGGAAGGIRLGSAAAPLSAASAGSQMASAGPNLFSLY